MNVRHCPACGREWRVPDHVLELYHHCPEGGPTNRRRFTYAGTTREEARTAVFEAAVKALGGDKSIWRPLDGEAE